MRFTVYENTAWGRALAPQAIATTVKVSGDVVPLSQCKLGRQISFFLIAGSLTGVTAFTCNLFGTNNGGTNWTQVVNDNAAAANVQFSGAPAIAGGRLDGTTIALPTTLGVLLGTIPLDRAPWQQYQLQNVGPVGATVNVAALYLITELYEMPPGVNLKTDVETQVDEWFTSYLPTGCSISN